MGRDESHRPGWHGRSLTNAFNIGSRGGSPADSEDHLPPVLGDRESPLRLGAETQGARLPDRLAGDGAGRRRRASADELRRARFHDSHLRQKSRRVLEGARLVSRHLRPRGSHRRLLPVDRGAARAAVARMDGAAHGETLFQQPRLLPPPQLAERGQSRPADQRGHPEFHGQFAGLPAHRAELDHHAAGLHRRAVDDLRRARRHPRHLRRGRDGDQRPDRPQAGAPALPAVRQGGGFPLRPRQGAGQRGVHRVLPGGKARAPRSGQPPLRRRGQHGADHHAQPQPRLFHQRLQLPRARPAHPRGGADVHGGKGGVRRGHPGGGSLRGGAGRRLADHHPVRRAEHLSRRHPAARKPVGRARRAGRGGKTHRAGGRKAAGGKQPLGETRQAHHHHPRPRESAGERADLRTTRPPKPSHHGRERHRQKLGSPHHRRPVARWRGDAGATRLRPPDVSPATPLHGGGQPARPVALSLSGPRRGG